MGHPQLRAGHRAESTRCRSLVPPWAAHSRSPSALGELFTHVSCTNPGWEQQLSEGTGEPAAWEGSVAQEMPRWVAGTQIVLFPPSPCTYTHHCWKCRLFFGPSTRYFPPSPSWISVTLPFAIWVRSRWLCACMGDPSLMSPGSWPSPLPTPTKRVRKQILQLLFPASTAHFWREALSVPC